MYYIFIFTMCVICAWLDQEERSKSVEAFRKGQKDVLVATDVASKGLDFEEIQHVINYDMPDDVENYGLWFTIANIQINNYFVFFIFKYST